MKSKIKAPLCGLIWCVVFAAFSITCLATGKGTPTIQATNALLMLVGVGFFINQLWHACDNDNQH